MATKAAICIRLHDNVYNVITANSDGYPEYTQRVLNEYYTNRDIINKLFDGGNVRQVKEKYTPNPLGRHSLEHSQPTTTVVYTREILNDKDRKLNEDEVEKIIKQYESKVIEIDDLMNIKKIHDYKYIDYVYLYSEKTNSWELVSD